MTQSSSSFNIFPTVMKVIAKTMALDIIPVSPLGSNSVDEMKKINSDIQIENRDRKINSVIKGSEYEKMKPQDHPSYKKRLDPGLMYFDIEYNSNKSSKKGRKS